jgi:hypothetical protein
MNWPDFWNGFLCVMNLMALTSVRLTGRQQQTGVLRQYQ